MACVEPLGQSSVPPPPARASYRMRRANVRDLALVLHHRRSMFEDMGETDAAALDRMVEVSRPLFERGLREGFYQGWFLEDAAGGVIAGAGLISLEFQPPPRSPDPRRSWIVNVYTEPEHRRRGLARELVTTIVAWSRAAGLRCVYLNASDHGRPLYEGLGFRPTNEMRLDLTVPQGDPE